MSARLATALRRDDVVLDAAGRPVFTVARATRRRDGVHLVFRQGGRLVTEVADRDDLFEVAS